MTIAARGGIIGDGNAGDRLEGAAAHLRNPHVAASGVCRKVAAIRHQQDLGTLVRQRAGGFRVFAVHANHQTHPDATRAGFDIACREAGAASAGEFGAVEVADMHLAMV